MCKKVEVVTKMTERIMQLVGVRLPDLTAIVAMRLDYADHLIDIGANEGRHRYWTAVQPLSCIAGFTFHSVELSPRLYAIYQPGCHSQWV